LAKRSNNEKELLQNHLPPSTKSITLSKSGGSVGSPMRNDKTPKATARAKFYHSSLSVVYQYLQTKKIIARDKRARSAMKPSEERTCLT